MTLTANWAFPTAVRFGAGRISELGDACKASGIGKPLFVTDPGLASLPITEQALGVVRGDGLEVDVFSAVDANPVAANVEAGLKVDSTAGRTLAALMIPHRVLYTENLAAGSTHVVPLRRLEAHGALLKGVDLVSVNRTYGRNSIRMEQHGGLLEIRQDM